MTSDPVDIRVTALELRWLREGGHVTASVGKAYPIGTLAVAWYGISDPRDPSGLCAELGCEVVDLLEHKGRTWCRVTLGRRQEVAA